MVAILHMIHMTPPSQLRSQGLTAAQLPLASNLMPMFRSHLSGIWTTLQMLNTAQLEPQSLEGQTLIADGIERVLHLLAWAQGSPEVSEPNLCGQLCRVLVIEELKRGLEQDQLCLHYQPIFELESMEQTGSIVGFEALLRWQHPQMGVISPDEFIPMAEETGFIEELGDWALRQACLQMGQWRAQGWTDLTISVNLSPRQFDHPALVDRILAILAETQVPPQCLRLELTESCVIVNHREVSQTLSALRQLGIRVGLDDFGTGHSSLSRLNELSLDFLKIDRSFVMNEKWEILGFILLLAQRLELQVVAEGIETVDQLQKLQKMGCNYGQGYLLLPPIPREDVESMLNQKFQVVA